MSNKILAVQSSPNRKIESFLRNCISKIVAKTLFINDETFLHGRADGVEHDGALWNIIYEYFLNFGIEE